jgi:hypothetical protein
MSLDKATLNLKFDKRLIEWNLHNGQLTEEEYNEYIQKMPDCKDICEPLSLEDYDNFGDVDQH